MRLLGFFKKFFYNIVFSIGRFFLNDKKILLFLIFLAISSGFWFLNALRKSYVAEFSYLTEFVNLPSDKTLGPNAPGLLKITVKGNGYTLLRYYLGRQFYPLSIDVSQMRNSSNGNKHGASIEPLQLTDMVKSQLSSDIELLEVNPSRIDIRFQNKTHKTVPVVFMGDLDFVQPYHQSGKIKMSPDSVVISGLESVIDTIQSINTEFRRFDGIHDSVSSRLNLQIPANVEVSHKHINVLVPSEPFTEAFAEVPLVVRGNPNGIIIKTFPAEIRVSFRVGLSRYEAVHSNQFLAVVDLAGIDLSTQKKLKVKLEKAPNYIYAVDYSPLFVDFIIEKF